MEQWKQARVVITGGGSGIGRQFAVALASHGATVCVADVRLAAAQEVATVCGDKAEAVALDVRDADAVKRVIEDFAARHGGIDYLFNNAGIGIAGETEEIPLSAWRQIVDINQMGVLHGVLAAYPLMLKQGAGHIINTASLAGLGPAPLLTPYAMTKHAVVGLTTSLRLEAAPRGVRVSALCPAAIETPLLDSGNPADANIGWGPDIRRFLTAMAGPPYPVDRAVAEALDAIQRNKAIIVLPGRARTVWRIGRWLPALVEKAVGPILARERKTRPR